VQEIETLRASGKTQEQIDAMVPKTLAERREKEVETRKSAVDLQTNVAFLLQEVQELRKMIEAQQAGGGGGGGGNGNGNGNGNGRTSDSDQQNMHMSVNANQGESTPWDASLGIQTGGSSIQDRQIVDAVSNK
jgi:hypothetical protein